MNLNDIQKAYKESARLLGDYSTISKTELANAYCDLDEQITKILEENVEANVQELEELKSAYFSALVLRYWYKISEWIQNSASLKLPVEEFVDWLVDSLQVAFRYREWRYEYKVIRGKHTHQIEGYKLDANGEKIVNPYYYATDENAVDKIFNRCIFSARGRAYQFANKAKRKDDNYKVSLEAMIEENGDAVMVSSGTSEESPTFDGVSEIIKILLAKDEVAEALIVDGIARHDTFRKDKGEDAEYFDNRKLVKHLNALTSEDVTAFCKHYGYVKEIKALPNNSFKDMNNKRLYRIIEKTLKEIKLRPELLNCLLN